MKKFLFTLFFVTVSAEPLKVDVKAEAALLINAETGQILYEKNAHKKYYPASITKIATALYALTKKETEFDRVVVAPSNALGCVSKEAKMKANYTLPAHWLETGGMHIGIKKGEELSFRDLLYGMMVTSGNDAANVIAHFTSGSVPKFMQDLNGYLKQIGCENTCFSNPHGLHHPEHQSTAYDMAIITREALQHPKFRKIVSTVRYERPKTNMQDPAPLVQTNRLLRRGAHFNPKAIGVKTGYTSDASHTFVAAAEHEGRTLIAVLLKAKEREDIFRDSNKLFEAAFNQAKVQKTLLKAGPQKYALFLENSAKPIKTCMRDDLSIDYYPAEEPSVKCVLNWRQDLALPVQKEQHVGDVHLLRSDGSFLHQVPIFAVEEVKHALSHRIKQWFSSTKIIVALLVLALTFWGLLCVPKGSTSSDNA